MDTPVGMSNVASALESAITPSALWGQITPLIVFVGIMVVFAFGYYILRRVTKGATKGKARV